MSLRSVWQSSVNRLRRQGIDSAQLDAELLLCAVLQCDRSQLFLMRADDELRRLDADAPRRFESLLQRRLQREPLAYIVGTKEFFGQQFFVNSSVLVPRPDTELLVECAIDDCRRDREASTTATTTVIDLATGSGNVLISTLLNLLPSMCGFGIDVSESALQVARRNAESLGVSNRCEFLLSDWFSNRQLLTKRILLRRRPTSLIITANPPYLDRRVPLSSKELTFEPSLALFGTAHDTYKPLIESCNEFLDQPAIRDAVARATLLLEIGKDMHDEVTTVARDANWTLVSQHRDLSNIIRVLKFRRQ